MEKRDKAFYWKLFKSTFLISAFTVGGGFVIVPLLRAKFVEEYKWLTDNETLELVAVAQSAPGVIAVNSAIILGYKMAGFLGALCATVATVLPCLITLSLISYFYESFAHNLYAQYLLKGMQAGATGIILVVLYDMAGKIFKSKFVVPILIMVGSFIANYFFDINAMTLILVDGIIGFLFLKDHKFD